MQLKSSRIIEIFRKLEIFWCCSDESLKMILWNTWKWRNNLLFDHRRNPCFDRIRSWTLYLQSNSSNLSVFYIPSNSGLVISLCGGCWVILLYKRKRNRKNAIGYVTRKKLKLCQLQNYTVWNRKQKWTRSNPSSKPKSSLMFWSIRPAVFPLPKLYWTPGKSNFTSCKRSENLIRRKNWFVSQNQIYKIRLLLEMKWYNLVYIRSLSSFSLVRWVCMLW